LVGPFNNNHLAPLVTFVVLAAVVTPAAVAEDIAVPIPSGPAIVALFATLTTCQDRARQRKADRHEDKQTHRRESLSLVHLSASPVIGKAGCPTVEDQANPRRLNAT
jgi:hypothetical protein